MRFETNVQRRLCLLLLRRFLSLASRASISISKCATVPSFMGLVQLSRVSSEKQLTGLPQKDHSSCFSFLPRSIPLSSCSLEWIRPPQTLNLFNKNSTRSSLNTKPLIYLLPSINMSLISIIPKTISTRIQILVGIPAAALKTHKSKKFKNIKKLKTFIDTYSS